MTGRPLAATRPRDLLGIAAAGTLLGWLTVRQWYGELPRLPAFVPLSLLVLAVAEGWAGAQLRARIRREPGARPVQPLAAARSLALAKASALVGAGMAGGWAGLLVYAVPRTGYLAEAGNDVRTAVLGMVAAGGLVGAALWLEYCCRAPEPPDRDAAAPAPPPRR